MYDTTLPSAGRPVSISIPRLRAAFNGQVIAPGDAGYDRARTVFLGLFCFIRGLVGPGREAADIAGRR
jgi:hypothetical protein